MEILKYWFFNPRESIFKTTSKDRVEMRTIQCPIKDKCSLFNKGECILVDAFSLCFYGKKTLEQGPTKNSKSLLNWIAERKDEYKEIKNLPLKSPNKKIVSIGDYIYFPYAHVSMNEGVPFVGHSGLFRSGLPFLHKDFFSLENIVKIIDFRPMALMGGEIFSYQAEEVPKILLHLGEEFPEIYNQVLDFRPDYITKYNLTQKKNIGRKAYLKTLNFPIKYSTKGSRDGKYKVEWEWDGKILKTSSNCAYNSIWGEVEEIEELKIEIKPKDSLSVTVQDESWVNRNTQFLD